MIPLSASYYLSSPPSALIFDLAHCQVLVDRGLHPKATTDEKLEGAIAYVERRKILASPALRAALARFTDELFHNPCDGRTWTIQPWGLAAHCPPDRIGCERFDEPIPRHPGVSPAYTPRPLLQESVR